MPDQQLGGDGDPQDFAEMYDEEAMGGDDETPVHHELLDPDLGGVDENAELVGTYEDAEGPVGPEDAAIHIADERELG